MCKRRLMMIYLITSFYAIYFFKQISLKKKNVDTNRLAKGNKPKNVVKLERFLLAFTYLTALFQYLSLFKFDFMGQVSNLSILKGTGILVTLSGVLIFFLATTHMKESWRAGIDKDQTTDLITTGIYQYSRNPAFVGFDLFYLGVVLMLPNIVLFGSSLITVICLHLQILEEEKYLIDVFGESYVVYKRKVRRYI
ncbi:hypothetical protein CBF28_02365 [Vagococcus carniphilus]|uniref:Isoprenylcysteine carboxylmethyltransferase family protein n=2 Tax=Vagococcus carniphilus TaxID=218144 RepID=A0A430B7T4_9ENTE|nr:hypothetical protein CBF28_02365 [Vagococcus carniphilus]